MNKEFEDFYKKFKKALQIIYIKQVDMGLIFHFLGVSNLLEQYNRIHLEAYQLTQEELELILKIKDLLFPEESKSDE